MQNSIMLGTLLASEVFSIIWAGMHIANFVLLLLSFHFGADASATRSWTCGPFLVDNKKGGELVRKKATTTTMRDFSVRMSAVVKMGIVYGVHLATTNNIMMRCSPMNIKLTSKLVGSVFFNSRIFSLRSHWTPLCHLGSKKNKARYCCGHWCRETKAIFVLILPQSAQWKRLTFSTMAQLRWLSWFC